jgi:hypothetical protein
MPYGIAVNPGYHPQTNHATLRTSMKTIAKHATTCM